MCIFYKLIKSVTMKIYENLDIENIDGEVWVDCIGYDGIYSVSNLGRVKSEERDVRCGKGWLKKTAQILKQQVVKSNPHNIRFESKSLRVSFCVDYQKKTYNVSELVGNAFIGEKKQKECYSKKNKKWDDCRAVNLQIKSISESTKESYKKGFCDRNKKTLTHNHNPVYVFKRLSDNKEFIGGADLRKEYGYDCQKGIKNSLKTGNKCKGSYWELIPI